MPSSKTCPRTNEGRRAGGIRVAACVRYREDPFLFPIAVPSLAGPSAITTVMILRSQQQADTEHLLVVPLLVFLATCAIFLPGRRISNLLGRCGIRAAEKLMGLLLNLVAVNMLLRGVRDYLAY